MDGIYNVKVKTPMGMMEGKITLKTKDNIVEGTFEMMGMKQDLGKGRLIKDDQCYFKGNLPKGTMNLQYEVMGKLQNNVLDIYAKTNMGEFKIQGKKIG